MEDQFTPEGRRRHEQFTAQLMFSNRIQREMMDPASPCHQRGYTFLDPTSDYRAPRCLNPEMYERVPGTLCCQAKNKKRSNQSDENPASKRTAIVSFGRFQKLYLLYKPDASHHKIRGKYDLAVMKTRGMA